MNRKDAKKEYKWNLLELYKNDEEFLDDLDIYIENNKTLLDFKGKLATKNGFLEFLKKSIQVEKLSSKLNHYLKYLFVEQDNGKLNNLESIYEKKLQQFDGKFSWVNEEIKNSGEKVILEWLNDDEELRHYSKSYKDFFKNIKYLLPEKERELISKISNSSSTIYEMYETMKFKDNEEKILEYKDKSYKVNQKFISDLLVYSDPKVDQELRALASMKFRENNYLKKHTYAKIYEAIVMEETETLKLVGMKDFKEYFFDKDDFAIEDFENLLDFTSKNSEVYYNFYRIIKKYLNLKKFYGTDASLNLFNLKNINYSLDESKKIIRIALKDLGDEYIKSLEYCWGTNKIDYFEDENKSTGAFTVNSYYFDSLILMNFTNDIESISTLVHEIGHAVHNHIAKKYQPKPLNGFSNMIAEVASTLNEHLLFDYLIKNETNNERKLILIQNRIEFLFNNFFSAIADAQFEYDCYMAVENNIPLNLKKISDLQKKANIKILGKSIFDNFNDEKYRLGWISISHFFEQPFYIYKYAVSIAMSFKLYSDFKITNDPNKILNFLKEGGSLEVNELFRKYDFDFKDQNSYLNLIEETKKIVEEFEKILLKK